MYTRSVLKPSYLKIATGISILFVVFYLLSPHLLEILELKTIDARFRNRTPVAPGNKVVIAVIDEKSIDEIGRWPWPRTTLAKLIDVLTSYQAKVVAFDIVFSEPTEHSELNALLSLKKKREAEGMPAGFADYVNRVKAEIDPDAQMARAIKNAGNVVLGYFFHFDQFAAPKEGRELSRGYKDIKVLQQGGENILNASAIESNIAVIGEQAQDFGYYNIVPDNDGSVRWNPLVIKYKDGYYAPLSLKALQAYLGNTPISLTLTDYGVAAVKLGNISIPIDESGRLLINYYGGQKVFPHYSITDILNGRIDKGQLKDKIVLIGATAIGIYDMRVTPFEGVYPGVEIHATVMDNILNKRFLIRPQWFSLLDIMIILGAGISLGIIIPQLSAIAGLFAAASFLAGYIYLASYLFNHRGLLVNITYPVLAIAATYLCLVLYRYALEAREKKKIKDTFQYYVAAPVMEELLKHPEKLKLGGEEKEITVLFSDIRRFTAISEELKPDKLISLLNEYLSIMSDAVFTYEGYLDKYIGDAIMAVYGAPLLQHDHSKKACLTALEMMERLSAIRKEWQDRRLPFLDIGIGINTGNMVVGNIGSKQKYDYTVIGDNVNLASRLEELNKPYGTNIIISDRVYRDVGQEFICRELDIVQVRGKVRAVAIYELMGEKGIPQLEDIAEIFRDGIGHYRKRRWEEAIKTFNKVLDLKSGDGPSKLYIQQSQQFIIHPPAENWESFFIIDR